MKTKKTIRYEDSAKRGNVDGWYCTECKRFWGEDEHMARYCCSNDLPCDCGKRKTPGWLKCEECRNIEQNRREQAEMDRAKLCEYDGNPIIVNGEFYTDLECYLEHVEQEGCEPEKYGFFTKPLGIYLSADEIWNNALESLEIDADIEPEGWKEFEAAVEAFSEANREINYWTEDNTRKFKIREEQ